MQAVVAGWTLGTLGTVPDSVAPDHPPATSRRTRDGTQKRSAGDPLISSARRAAAQIVWETPVHHAEWSMMRVVIIVSAQHGTNRAATTTASAAVADRGSVRSTYAHRKSMQARS